MSLPACAPQARLVRAHHLAPIVEDRARHLGAVRQQSHRGQRRHRLARPAFPDQRHRLALAHSEADMPDGLHHPPVLSKLYRQIADLKHAHRKVFRGSKASRTPSKMKTSRTEHDREGEEGGEAEPRRVQRSLALQRQLAERGRRGRQPEPEEVERSEPPIAPVMMKGSSVSVATIAFGRTWRNMMTWFATPSARAARTYSKLRARRNSARTTPTSEVQPKKRDQQRQQPEVHREDRREDDDDVEARHVDPELDDALEEEVDQAAEIALHRTRRDRRWPRSAPSRPARRAPRGESRRSPAPDTSRVWSSVPSQWTRSGGEGAVPCM